MWFQILMAQFPLYILGYLYESLNWHPAKACFNKGSRIVRIKGVASVELH